MGKPKTRLDDAILKGAVDHLKYEIAMLKETAGTLSQQPRLSWAVKNALVESWVIHARGLILFLYHSPAKEDDVMACDYFRDGTWEKHRRPIPGLLETTLTRANKEVAHITTFRIGKRLVDKQWDHNAITACILDLFRDFFGEVPEARMPGGYVEWFRALTSAPPGADVEDTNLEETSTRST